MMRLYQNILSQTPLAMPAAARSNMGSARFAVMEERGRMAREIHDTLAQEFAGILFYLEAITDAGCDGRQLGSNCSERLDRAKHLARRGLEDARRMLLGLRPKSLEGASLARALKELAQRCARDWRIACEFRASGLETDLPSDVEDELYRITQEALCNIHKHSRATSVSILLSCGPDGIALTIKDDGRGFPTASPKSPMEGFGLSSMRERALGVGGSLDILSAPRRGTEVKVTVPLPESPE